MVSADSAPAYVVGHARAGLAVARLHQHAEEVEVRLGRLGAAALDQLRAITGGTAGLIAIDRRDRIALHLTPTMPVAWVDAHGPRDAIA